MIRSALLIGSNGQHGLAMRLEYAEHDLDRVSNWLRGQPGWESAHIDIVQKRSELRAALRRVPQGRGVSNGFLFVYFSGHGTSRDDDLYLTLADSAVAANEIVETCVARSSHRAVVVVLDCCYAGLAASQTVGQVLHRLTTFGRTNERHPNDGVGRVVIAACTSTQQAFEGITREGVEGGFLTTALMEGCDGGRNLEAIEPTGIVTAESLVSYLRGRLKRHQRLEPLIYGAEIAIKTTLDWRSRNGVEVHVSPQLLMFPESDGREAMPNVTTGSQPIWKKPEKPRGEIISCFGVRHPLTVAVGFRPKGAAVYGDPDSSYRWDASSDGTNVVPSFRGIRLSPDGRLAFVRPSGLSESQTPILAFESQTGKQIATFSADGGLSDQFVVSSDGKLLIGSSPTGVLHVWAAENSAMLLATVQSEVLQRIRHMRPFLHGKSILYGGTAGTVGTLDVSGLGAAKGGGLAPFVKIAAIQEELGDVTRVAANGNETRIAAGFGKGTARVWEISALGQLPLQIPAKHAGFVSSLEFSRDGEWLATGGIDGQVWLTHILERPIARPIALPKTSAGTPAQVSALDFFTSRDMGLVAIGTTDGRVFLQELGSDKLVAVPSTNRKSVLRVLFIDGGMRSLHLLIGGDPQVELWEISWS